MHSFSGLQSVEQLILQGTPFCNLNCTYCDLSEESRRTKTKMPLELVYQLLEQLINEQLLGHELVIIWHSGEPLVLPTTYYVEAVEGILEFCKRKAPHLSLKFDFQTNATLINDKWCDFFEKYSHIINLGVSCDGPLNVHDAFRVDWKGRGTYERTRNGMYALEARGIPYNLIAVVNKKTMTNPKNFFDYFLRQRKVVTDFHFNILASPINTAEELNYSAEDRQLYYSFYRKMFSFWTENESAGKYLPIRNFTQTLQRLAAYEDPTNDTDFLKESSAPLKSLNMDAKGNITTFYAGLDIGTEIHRYGDGQGLGLGNIQTKTLAEMLSSAKLAKIMSEFSECHKNCASECDYYSVCPGGFELLQLSQNKIETTECVIHVKTLTDAVIDEFSDCLEKGSSQVKVSAQFD
ncbi:MAG: radical SAM protein [Cognaticolwellia sp.]